MAKQIDPEEASAWTDEEFAFNVQYLEDRLRFAEANECKRVREEGSTPRKGNPKKED